MSYKLKVKNESEGSQVLPVACLPVGRADRNLEVLTFIVEF